MGITTSEEMIALINEMRDKYDWHHRQCGGNFGRLEVWWNHSPERENEAERHWYYFTCKKCGSEVSLKNLVSDTQAGFFQERKTFMEELMEA